jgi:hemolysin III
MATRRQETSRRQAVPIRPESPRELWADQAVHLLGLTLGLIGCGALLALTPAGSGPAMRIALAVYGAGLLAMLTTSALYNMSPPGPRRALLRRVDHGAIFIMIAGTYTPFTLLAIGGTLGHGLLVFVWVVALLGVVLKLLALERFDELAIGAYLALGWVGVLAADPLIAHLTTRALVLLVAGGVVYSVGVLIYRWRNLPFHRALWHLFVLVAAACHYVAILTDLVLGAPAR